MERGPPSSCPCSGGGCQGAEILPPQSCPELPGPFRMGTFTVCCWVLPRPPAFTVFMVLPSPLHQNVSARGL